MVTRRGLLVVAALLTFPEFPALADCESGPARIRVEGRSVAIAFTTQPASIKVGEMFSLHATLCPKPGAGAVGGVKVDASMPDHRHGMNYQPRVVRSGENSYTASGLMFHMPGRWQFVFDVDSAGGRERILADYLLD